LPRLGPGLFLPAINSPSQWRHADRRNVRRLNQLQQWGDMLRSYLVAIRHADWRSPVLLAIFGVVLFFVCNIIKLGAPGGTDPIGHALGIGMVSLGWLAIGAAVLLLWQGIQAARATN
jgi:hypothetical protein